MLLPGPSSFLRILGSAMMHPSESNQVVSQMERPAVSDPGRLGGTGVCVHQRSRWGLSLAAFQTSRDKIKIEEGKLGIRSKHAPGNPGREGSCG